MKTVDHARAARRARLAILIEGQRAALESEAEARPLMNERTAPARSPLCSPVAQGVAQ